MHGEYKIPGGKLVVVDLEVAGGRVQSAQVSGDFFLHPDEALSWMADAVAGLPADAPEDMIAERVRAAVAGAELLGVTPEGVATAVRRALDGGAW
jgi:lipoate-protein ligase A